MLRALVGSYAAVMDGIDVLTFTAGIGENDADIRREVCAGLGFLGLKLDEAKNAERSRDARVISAPDSTVTVMVVPTNEELAIARQAVAQNISRSTRVTRICGSARNRSSIGIAITIRNSR